MSVAREAGAKDARVVSYANSSEVAIGDAERVVGYGAVSFSTGERRADAHVVQDRAPEGPDRLDAEDRRALLALARATITQFLDTETFPLPRDVPPHLHALHQGAFVTLREHGQLRGCIGRVWHDGPLPQLVSAMAYEAAFQDPRFGPLSADEVDDLEVEVSVLTPPQPAEAEDIEPGRHGVLLRKQGRSAVFLPKVATEQGWDREQLLDHLCLKGGLPARSWTRDASLFTFEAEVFDEARDG
jgi:AmmeMemoRadiSam system protein A